jgi:hypothetical protein
MINIYLISFIYYLIRYIFTIIYHLMYLLSFVFIVIMAQNEQRCGYL